MTMEDPAIRNGNKKATLEIITKVSFAFCYETNIGGGLGSHHFSIVPMRKRYQEG